jgi:hypothetical protein
VRQSRIPLTLHAGYGAASGASLARFLPQLLFLFV